MQGQLPRLNSGVTRRLNIDKHLEHRSWATPRMMTIRLVNSPERALDRQAREPRLATVSWENDDRYDRPITR